MSAAPSRKTAAALAGCLLLGALASLAVGQDAFWDTRNYHLYNAWAWLADRYGRDITPAGMQSYFNPLPDLPYFLLGTGWLKHAPRVLAALQGLWFGALLFVVGRIAARLAALHGRRFGAADAFAALIGVSGTMAVSQLGSTTHEIPLAVLVLGSLYLLLPREPAAQGSSAAARMALAGLCAGLAAGLKPTAIVYGPALAAALLAAQGPTRQTWKLLLWFALGALPGFVAAYGWWGVHLWQATGNPIFPMFNQVFHSSQVPAAGGTDGRFRPRDPLQWLFYPFYWVVKNQWLVTEAPLADARYALAMIAAVVIAVAAALRRRGGAVGSAGDAAIRAVLCFSVVGYAIWLVLFSILRYLVPVEALTGVLMLYGLRAAGVRWREPVLMALLLLAIAAGTRYPSWGRTTYAGEVFAIQVPEVEPGSLVLLTGSPVGYLAPFFPHAEQLQFVGLTWFTHAARGYGLWERTSRTIHEHAGPIYVVRRDGAEFASELALMQELAPGRTLEACQPIVSHLETDRARRDHAQGLRLCRLVPAAGGQR